MNLKEEIFNECITRMQLLNLSYNCIRAFKGGKVWESEGIGALYEINEKEQEIVNNFEKEHTDYKVYHLIHSLTNFGEIYTIFYVSPNKEEWEQDKEDLKENIAFTYVHNVDDEWCSEFGTIGFRKNIGGLIRVS